MDEIENDSRDAGKAETEHLETLFEDTFNESHSPASKKDQKETPNTPLFAGSFVPKKNKSKLSDADPFDLSDSEKPNVGGGDGRSKTPLRMKYEAEVEAIKKTDGDLEDIRRKLKLSKRKVSQLLLVDPSAWTRWTGADGDAPPHIYRSLQWYLILQDKHPELKSNVWLNSVAQPQLSRHEIENIKQTVRLEIKKEEQELSTERAADFEELRRQFKAFRSNQRTDSTQWIRYLIYFVAAQTLLIFALTLYTFTGG